MQEQYQNRCKSFSAEEKRQVPLIIFTEKGNRMDCTPALLKLEASELQIRTRTAIQDQTKKSLQLSSLPSATSNTQDRGTGLRRVLLQIGWIYVSSLHPSSFQQYMA